MYIMIIRVIFTLLAIYNVQCMVFSDGKTNPRSLCPQLYQKTFRGYVPKGNITAGIVGISNRIC